MAKLHIIARAIGGENEGQTRGFMYDNMTNKIWLDKETRIGDVGGKYEHIADPMTDFEPKYEAPYSPENPGKKSKGVRRLKIQLGMSCNYECTYCSQRFVERPIAGTPDKIDGFIARLQAAIDFPENGKGLRIEFWGGEPLVYLKTLQPLAEKLRAALPQADFSIITNGSMLTRPIVDWLVKLNFIVSISHDGPGQHVRGPDPIDDGSEVTKDGIRYAYEKIFKTGRGSFNAMVNAKNQSRMEIQKWFEERFDADLPPIGEGGFIDSYDEGGQSLCLNSKQAHFDYRKLTLKEVVGGGLRFHHINNKMNGILQGIMNAQQIRAADIKCGISDESTLIVDMEGNVITCQNVSANQTAPNGESHRVGSLDDLEGVKLNTITHWTDREHCRKCPVLSMCRGSCTFLQDENFYKSCESSYSDNIAIFAAAFLKVTGYVPFAIDADHLPDHRKDIWGDILKHEEEKPKKAFPIKVVSK